MKPRRKRRRAFALLSVLVVLAVLAVMLYEFTFNTQVRIDRSALSRDELQAHFVAQSAYGIARAILHAQKTFVDPLQRSIGTNIQLWNIAMGPASIDFCRTELLRTLSAGGSIGSVLDEIGLGALAMMTEKKGEERERTPASSSTSTTTSSTTKKDDKPKTAGFLGMPYVARCSITDEDRKFNLNRCCSTEDVKAITTHIISRLQGPDWDKYFAERDPDGQTTTREELAAAVVDWIDTDTEKIGGGYEDSFYQGLRDPYHSKNAKFDTLKELHLVRGMSDKLMREVFEPDFTVFSSGRVNIATASREVLLTLLRAYAKNPYDRALDPRNQELEKALGAFMQQRNPLMGGGIGNTRAFVDTFRSVMALEEDKLLAAIDIQSRVFRIEIKVVEVVGEAPNTYEITRKKVTAIVDNGPVGGKLLYWREE